MARVGKDTEGAGESRVIVSAEESFSPHISVEQEAEIIEVWGSVSYLIFLFCLAWTSSPLDHGTPIQDGFLLLNWSSLEMTPQTHLQCVS